MKLKNIIIKYINWDTTKIFYLKINHNLIDYFIKFNSLLSLKCNVIFTEPKIKLLLLRSEVCWLGTFLIAA